MLLSACQTKIALVAKGVNEKEICLLALFAECLTPLRFVLIFVLSACLLSGFGFASSLFDAALDSIHVSLSQRNVPNGFEAQTHTHTDAGTAQHYGNTTQVPSLALVCYN